jgi:hypothetical protein
MNGYFAFAVVAAILIIANTVCTVAVGKSDFYESRQKFIQIFLVWLLPILGILLVGGVLWSNYARPSSSTAHPEHEIPDFVRAGAFDSHPGGGPSI